jgi:PPM family protein phosphatase
MREPSIEADGATDVGQRRDHNEDAWTVLPPGGGAGWVVCAVADGMGGHLAGEVASARAIETIERELATSESDPGEALRTVLERANALIWDEAQNDPEKAGMGSTIVCAIVDGGRAFLANVGDSPAFLVSDGQVEQLTRDHSWAAEQVSAGSLAAEEAEQHPFRHVLTRCLGAEAEVEVELYPPRDLSPGDALVLCSDGLTEHVQPDEIAPALASADTPKAAAQALIDLANQRGGHDNITVVVARVPR